jgi:hypothetical protein
VVDKWAGYSALGTFLLHLLGYLALRFQRQPLLLWAV